MLIGTIDSKIPFTPKRWQILRREFLTLSRFMLCYPSLPQNKDLPSIIGCKPIRSFQEIAFAKSATYGVKGILLLLERKRQKYARYPDAV